MVHLKKYKIAIVGLGKMGRNHLRVAKSHGGFEVSALVDPDSATEKLVETPETQWYKSVSDFTKSRIPVDAVIVATTTSSHAEVVQSFFGLNVPILVEKPLAHTARDAENLAEIAAAKRIPVFVGHTERSNPAVRKLKEVIDSNLIGKPIHFSTTRVGGFPNAKERKSTNVLLDLAVHDLDVLRILSGPMQLRSSICHKTLDGLYPDTAHLLLFEPSGCSGSIHVNWITPTKIRTIEVTGTLGFAQVDYIMQTCKVVGGNLSHRRERPDFTFADVVADYSNSDRIEFGVAKKEPLLVQAEELYQFLRTGTCALCTASDGAETVRLAEMALTFGQGGMTLAKDAS